VRARPGTGRGCDPIGGGAADGAVTERVAAEGDVTKGTAAEESLAGGTATRGAA
jgi:hypothetical protein